MRFCVLLSAYAMRVRINLTYILDAKDWDKFFSAEKGQKISTANIDILNPTKVVEGSGN